MDFKRFKSRTGLLVSIGDFHSALMGTHMTLRLFDPFLKKQGLKTFWATFEKNEMDFFFHCSRKIYFNTQNSFDQIAVGFVQVELQSIYEHDFWMTNCFWNLKQFHRKSTESHMIITFVGSLIHSYLCWIFAKEILSLCIFRNESFPHSVDRVVLPKFWLTKSKSQATEK